MKGKRAYIDTNIFIYVAVKHPYFYEECYNILEKLVEKEYAGYGSSLILFELFGALAKINVNAAYDAVNQYLNLPIKLLNPNRETFVYAKEIAMHSKTTYDSLHAALMVQNNICTIITEDLEDWRKMLSAWHKLKEKYKLNDLAIISPTKGIIKHHTNH